LTKEDRETISKIAEHLNPKIPLERQIMIIAIKLNHAEELRIFDRQHNTAAHIVIPETK
jgi:hypothetical protein